MRIGSVVLAAMALALAGCGRDAAEEAAGAGAAPSATGSARGAGDAVSAVLHSQGTPLARIAFLIPERPVAGKAFSLQLQISPAEGVPSVQLAAESSSLVAAPAEGLVTFNATREAVNHDLAVTAQQEGLADLTVRLRSEGVADETVYVIPVLVSKAE